MAKIIKKARDTVKGKKPKVKKVAKIPKKIHGKKVVVKYVHVSKKALHKIHKKEKAKKIVKAKKAAFKGKVKAYLAKKNAIKAKAILAAKKAAD
jgi:hypothetical protein